MNEEILELQIRDNAAIAATGLSSLAESIEKLKSYIGRGLNLTGIANGIEKVTKAINGGVNLASVSYFERIADALERIKSVGGIKIGNVKGMVNTDGIKAGFEGITEKAVQTGSDVAAAIDKGFVSVGERVREDVGDATTSMDDLKESTEETGNAMNNAKHNSRSFTDGIRKLKEALHSAVNSSNNMIGKAHEMVSAFARIAKYRVIRSVIKQITEAFSTGIENVYWYSKAIGGEFASSMDSAASSLLYFKNSLGAAVAPLLQSMIPVLETIINAVVEAVNWLNQFISLWQGKTTWTRAIRTSTNAFEDNKNAAKKAGKTMKELLADWDELNIIQSETGGSGKGGISKMEEAVKMFEETSDFNGFLKDNFQTIKTLVEAIGAGILLWKVSSSFGASLNTLLTLAGLGFITIGLVLSWDAGQQAGLQGKWDKNTLRTAVGGAIATGVGGALISSKFGIPGAYGFLIGVGVSVLVSIVSFSLAKKEFDKEQMWGNSKFKPEDVREYIQGQFTFDINAEIRKIHAITEDRETAKRKLENDIDNFTKELSLTKIRVAIKADNTNQGLETLKDSAEEVISQYNESSATNLSTLKASLEILPIVGEDGKLTDQFLASITEGTAALEDYMTDLGKKIAEAYNKGLLAEWGNGTYEAYMEQIEKLNRINKAQQEYESTSRMNQFSQDVDFVLEKMGYENSQTAFEEIESLKNEYIEETRSELKSRMAGNTKEAAQTSAVLQEIEREAAAAGIAPEDYDARYSALKSSLEDLETLIQLDREYLMDVEGYLKKAKPEYNESLAKFRERWVNILQEKEGIDWYGNSSAVAKGKMSWAMQQYARGATGAQLRSMFDDALKFGDFGMTDLAKNIMKESRISIFEAMDENDIAKFVEDTIKYAAFEGVDGEQFLRETVSTYVGGDRVMAYLNKRMSAEFSDKFDELLNGLGIESTESSNAIKEKLLGGTKAERELFYTLLNEMESYTGASGSYLKTKLENAYEKYMLQNAGALNGTDASYVLEYLKQVIDSMTYPGTEFGYGNGMEYAWNYLFNGGQTPTPEQGEISAEEMETIMKNSNATLESQMQSILTVVNQILRKDPTVRIVSDSAFGGAVKQGTMSIARVTGNYSVVP